MPPMELGVASDVTDQTVGIVELARTVEDVGLESLFVFEHTHVPVSRRDVLEDEFHAGDARLLDQFTVLGAAAAVTSRVKLGTGICVVPQHDTIQLAKQVATIDHLSGGRFLFGVAAGWLVEEMRNHGVDPSTRWERMAEQLSAMKAIWTRDEAEFHGRFVDFDPIWLWPKPVQQPHPPILVGGSGERGLRVAIAEGDAWAPVVESPEEFERDLAALSRACEEAGRPRPPITVFTFEADEKTLDRYAELGVTRSILWAPTDSADALRECLQRCAALSDRLR